MNQIILTHRSAPAPRPIRTAFATLKEVKERLVAWRLRQRERAALFSLSDAELQDIGISRAQADFESSKPFWRD
jgi:uncharacterized protein YjiS (DUF1127 family)